MVFLLTVLDLDKEWWNLGFVILLFFCTFVDLFERIFDFAWCSFLKISTACCFNFFWLSSLLLLGNSLIAAFVSPSFSSRIFLRFLLSTEFKFLNLEMVFWYNNNINLRISILFFSEFVYLPFLKNLTKILACDDLKGLLFPIAFPSSRSSNCSKLILYGSIGTSG